MWCWGYFIFKGKRLELHGERLFFYELCVPEYPEVTEPVYSSAMIRVKPLEKECAQITEQYLKTIAYNGNNLFWTDWDEEHMEGIDYNGLFEYLCEVRGYGTFDQARYTNGIPGQEFEELMTSCLPVTREELREYAAYDSDSGMYEWIDLGVGNRTLGAIVSCIPEVTAAEKNDDGTMTLTVMRCARAWRMTHSSRTVSSSGQTRREM